MKLRRVAAGAISVVLAITMVSTSAFAVDPSFKDVPSNHWAKQSITAMADKGIMTGVADGVFAPSNTLTYAEFFTMLTRQFYADKLSGEGEYWYSQFVAAAAAAGIDQGLSMKSVTDVITRYDMAQIMYNLMSKKGVQMPSNVDTSKIADWSKIPQEYQKAVSVCYSLGTLSGTDSKGTFNGAGNMDRAQAAVVMSRLLEVCEGTPAPTPTPTPTPSGSKQITSITQLLTKDGMEEYPGGFHANPDLVSHGSAGMGMDSKGYSTFSFTFKAAGTDTSIEYWVKDVTAGYVDPAVLKETVVVKAGETKTFTLDCSNSQGVGLEIYNAEKETPYSFSEGWITNITFS